MTGKTPDTISPREADDLLKQGALLVDVREVSERAEVIRGALHVPMSRIDEAALPVTGTPVIFHCRTGRRTATNAGLLQGKAGQRPVYLLDGGIDGWAA